MKEFFFRPDNEHIVCLRNKGKVKEVEVAMAVFVVVVAVDGLKA
jgi:hypothetical protein